MLCNSFHNIEILCSLVLVTFPCEAAYLFVISDFSMEISHFRLFSISSGVSFGKLHFPGKLSIFSRYRNHFQNWAKWSHIIIFIFSVPLVYSLLFLIFYIEFLPSVKSSFSSNSYIFLISSFWIYLLVLHFFCFLTR